MYLAFFEVAICFSDKFIQCRVCPLHMVILAISHVAFNGIISDLGQVADPTGTTNIY